MKRLYHSARPYLLYFSLYFLVVGLCASPVFARNTAEDLYQSAKKEYHRFSRSSRQRKYRDRWERVIHRFEEIASRYPHSRRADDALYNAARITLKLRRRSRAARDTDAALKILARIVRDYPKSRYADDAQYLIGEIYRKIRNNPVEAYRAYAVIPNRFPHGDMVKKARARLAGLPAPKKVRTLPVVAAAPVLPPRSGRRGMAQITGIRHWSGSDYVRVVIDLSGPVQFEKHRLSNPARIYVDLKGSRLSTALGKNPIPVSGGYLKAIRAGQFDQDTARVVLDFEKIRNVSIFPLQGPDRIVMDVAGEESVLERLSRVREGKIQGDRYSPSLSEQLGMKVAKVVIDPGHGGKDPGCIGRSGLKEKDITLDIGLRLKKLLEKKLRLQVVMTRDRDVFVPLDERTAIANREKADLFISIHVNAAKSHSVRGVETWFLDLAASERAKKIAARENSSSSKPMSDLQSILNDLLLSNKTQESSRLAETLQEFLTQDLKERYKGIRNLGVKGAPFVVLVGARMPSVLSEVSFISNPSEERRLKQDRYRDSIAMGLFQGVSAFMKSPEYAFTKPGAGLKD